MACLACTRPNAPTRLSCLYCGAGLPLTGADRQRPTLRPLEDWAQGHNVVALPPDAAPMSNEPNTPSTPPIDWPSVADWCKLPPATLARVAHLAAPLPLARVATPNEAALIAQRLADFGLRVVVVADQDLAARAMLPRRARAAVWDESGLAVQLTGGDLAFSVEWQELTALVVGRLTVNRTDAETRATRRGTPKIVASHETSQDEAVLDVYTREKRQNWRVYVSGFDFSCLGAAKQMLAKDNFALFVETLRHYAPHVGYFDTYAQVRPLLAEVWPVTPQVGAGGVQRTMSHTTRHTTTTASNDLQFTRWSRLCAWLANAEART